MSDNRWTGIVLLSMALAAGGCLSAGLARADSLRFRVDGETVQSSTHVTNKLTGESLDSDASRNRQRYDIGLSKNVYPNLMVRGGALYEQTDTVTSTAGQSFESDETFLRPFARLSLDSPMYRGGIGYQRTEITNDSSGGDSTRRYQDNINTILGWRPEGLPQFTVRYDQTHSRDDAETLDTLERDWNLESIYSGVKGLQLYYFYRQEESENRIADTRTTTYRHNGRVDYSHGFFDNRLNLSTGYQVFYDRVESQSQGIVDVDIVPAAGLFSIDDTPQDGPALAVNNALIDGLRNVSAGIDIGLAGDETTLTNIGIDLGLKTDINRILLWVDRRLTAGVAGSFTWQVYTSNDNKDTSTWNLAATVSPAPFGTFENRFEIVFPAVNTRYIKLVVRPLSPAVVGSVSFPNIFVTEIEPFSEPTRAAVVREQESVDQNGNLSLTGRLSENTTVGYDMYYRSRERDRITGTDTDTSSELSNGVFLRHIFNSKFSANARVQRTETENNQDRTTDTDYSASLRADYLETFNQILTYAGAQTDADEGTSTTQSLFLRNNLQLYQGWSAFADMGLTYDESALSERTDTRTLRLGTNVVPHRTLTVNLDYQWRSVETAAAETLRLTDVDYNFQVFYVPFPALSFFGKYTLRERQNKRTTLQSYSANWSPFPDGTLQCALNFNETLQPEEDRVSRNFGPFVKWNISRYLSLETQYSVNISDAPTQEVESQTLQAKLTFIW